jgi:dihydroxyacetone kinase-like protein
VAGTATLPQLVDWLTRFRDVVAENQAYLTELDSAIGDADHGSNMARGMNAVIGKLGEPAAVDALFKTVGMTLVSTVGGASGPLYGTFFLRIGTTAGGVTELDGAALSAALRAGLAGVIQRGNAQPGVDHGRRPDPGARRVRRLARVGRRRGRGGPGGRRRRGEGT